MLKKLFISVILCAMVATSMVGCGKDSSKDDKKADAGTKTITVWAWDEKFNIAAMNEAIAQYKAPENVKFEVVPYSKEDVYKKLQAGLAAGGKGLPDIILLEDYVSAKYRESFPGSFADLTNDFDYDKFLDFKVEATSEKGKHYAVPFDTGAAALYYRIDLIQEAGYTEKDMEDLTWSKFIQIGKDVKAKTGVDMIVEIANNKTTLVRSMLQSCGSWYFDKDGNIDIASNKVLKEAFNIILDLKKEGILFEAESTEGRAAALSESKAASVINAPWFISALKASPEQSGKWRATRIPKMDNIDGATNASNVGGSSWYVLNNSKVKKEAIAFMKDTWGKNTDFYDKILLNQGAVGSYLPSYKSDAYKSKDEFFGGQEINSLFTEILPEVQGVNFGGYVAEANDAITTALTNLYTGGITVDDALKQAESQLKTQLGR